MDSLTVGAALTIGGTLVTVVLGFGLGIWGTWRTLHGQRYFSDEEVLTITLIFSISMGMTTLGAGIAMSGHLYWAFRCLMMLTCTTVGLIMGGRIMEKRGFLLVRRAIREWVAKERDEG